MKPTKTYNFGSKTEVIDYFDDYAHQKRTEIDEEKLTKEEGLIKSYWLESQNDDGKVNIPEIIGDTDWHLKQIGNDEIYQIKNKQDTVGFLEPVSKRHLVLHTTKGFVIDSAVRRTVNETDQLDFAWLSGSFFQNLWKNLILDVMPERVVKFKFEYDAYFEKDYINKQIRNIDRETGEIFDEQKSSTSEITEKSSKIEGFLRSFQEKYAPFYAIKMLRIPASGMHGGYDFYSWGKVTYRAQDFRQGRGKIFRYTKIYEKLTENIENTIWLQTEKNKVKNGIESLEFTGAPVTICFNPELPLEIFRTFIITTFDKGLGPLRLWGSPIWMGERKVHIYGIDMHLWQKVYFEITPKRLIAILPKGTCGNTVHRLVTNIQRHVSPGIETFVGDVKYEVFVRNAIFGSLDIGELVEE